MTGLNPWGAFYSIKSAIPRTHPTSAKLDKWQKDVLCMSTGFSPPEALTYATGPFNDLRAILAQYISTTPVDSDGNWKLAQQIQYIMETYPEIVPAASAPTPHAQPPPSQTRQARAQTQAQAQTQVQEIPEGYTLTPLGNLIKKR